MIQFSKLFNDSRYTGVGLLGKRIEDFLRFGHFFGCCRLGRDRDIAMGFFARFDNHGGLFHCGERIT